MDKGTKVISNRKKYLVIVSLIVIAILLYFTVSTGFYSKVIGVLQPVLIGAVLAYLLNPLLNLYQSLFGKLFNKISKKPEKLKTINKGISITLTMISFFAVVAAILWLIIPQISNNIAEFIKNAPAKAEAIAEWYQSIADKYDLPSKFGVISEWLDENGGFSFATIITYLEENLFTFSGVLGNEIISFFGTTFSVVFNTVIGLIVCVYLLSSKQTLSAQIKKIMFAFFSKNKVEYFLDTAREGNRIVTRFIIGKLIDSTIVGFMCFVTLLIFDIPYPLLISVIVGITDIIPFFGPYLGAIPCTLLILLSNDPIKAIYFVIIIIVIQQVEGNIISPKIIGDTIGLSPFWVLTAMLVGGGLFGLPGMLLGVPVIAIIFFIIKKATDKRLAAKDLPISTADYVDESKLLD